MKRALVLVLAGLLSACTLFGGTFPATTTPGGASTQEIARTLVLTLKDAWDLTGQMCVDVSASEGPDGGQALRDQCRATLMPALDELHAAALLVDAWDSASQKNFGCAVSDVVNAINEAWRGTGQPEPPLVMDAFAQAHNFFAGSCPSSDAGAPDGAAE